jgi:chromatin remodeling complex protein RSC6
MAKPTKVTTKTTTASSKASSEPKTPVKASTEAKTPAKVVKAKVAATPIVVAAPAPVPPTPVVAASNDVVETPEEPPISEQFSVFMSKLQLVAGQFSALRKEFTILEKKCVRELRVAKKLSGKRKKGGNRAPSGFVKPTLITDELATFLGKPSGAEMARTEVTKEINTYIRANNLQDKDNGRKINPDAPLAKLLKISGGDELTYFNLQRYMSPHFPKTGAAAAAALAAAAAATATASASATA